MHLIEKKRIVILLEMITLFWPYVSDQTRQAIAEVLKTRWIGQGPAVESLERKFETLLATPHAISLNSCTSAIHLALILAGVGEGDEVITTPMTCSATNIPILYCRAKAVFADIQTETLNIDPESVTRKITPKTKAVLAVHWGGQPCDMDALHDIAKKKGLAVIEDAAHALGATYHGKSVGALSDFTCFSFQAIKQVTSGDGGMLTTLHAEWAHHARLLRWYGMDRNFKGSFYEKHHITEVGYKYHMNDIVATMVSTQLDELPTLASRRKDIVNRYRKELSQVPGLTLLQEKKDRTSGNWLFTILVEKRDDFMNLLAGHDIESHLVHVRCDIFPIFGGGRQELPIMNHAESRYVSIPLHNHLTDEDVTKVIHTIQQGW